MRNFHRVCLVSIAAAALTLASCSRQAPLRTYSMGERVTLGRLVYTAFETQWVTKLGDDPTPRVPEHRFFLVRMSIVNGAGEEMLTPNVFLEDDKGNSYPEVSDGTGVPQWIGYLRHIKPAESAQGNMVFDVPPAHYKLRVFDAQGEQAALIDIPLSFGSETPDVAVPEQLRRQQ